MSLPQSHNLKIGTRQSPLAIVQAQWVQRRLEGKGISTRLVPLSSPADESPAQPLNLMAKENPGVFTKFLEDELLKGTIDIAVHSLKDMPTLVPSGLKILAVTAREKTRDVLRFVKKAGSVLKKGAKVGTSSLRREAQLLNHDPSISVVPLRGNVATRLERLRTDGLSAIVLAEAGLYRLGLLEGSQDFNFLPLDWPSSPGQGALAIETLQGRFEEFKEILHDEKTERETTLERKVLRELEGGCSLPLAVSAIYSPTTESFSVKAFLGIKEGAKWQGFYPLEVQGDGETCFAKLIGVYAPLLPKVPVVF